jgi:hypothetical protein
MLVAAFMFVISVAAMVQFAVFTWRAGLLRIAAEQLPGESAFIADASGNLLNQEDFADASTIQEICPDLSVATAAPNLTPVRLYHSFLSALKAVGEMVMPAGELGLWTDREMALCTRYSNVVLSRRLMQNQRAADQMRSF